jgi:hypothetical protein
MHDLWNPLSVSEVRNRFEEVSIPWWIAGGLALDLFLGWETRPHADIDIEIFRSDRDVLFDVFPDWDLQLMSGGELSPFNRGQEIAPSVFGVWGRPSPADRWAVEIMLADGTMTEWMFRRDNAIALPGDQLLRRTADGVPYCTPEVQLLYKSKMARPKDDVDFARCLHRLTYAQRGWLADAIASSEPEHPWIVALHAANADSMNEA